jgi:biopolymer transport protein TolR
MGRSAASWSGKGDVEALNSSPAFAGEGDHAEHGGGATWPEGPLHRVSRGPPPLEIEGRNEVLNPFLGGERRGRRTPMAEINVTPMVDVMLVLLIIFMVTAPLLVAGVAVDLPETKAGGLDQEQKPLSISLDAAGKIFLGEDEIAPDRLGERLAQAAAGSREQGGPRVLLRADRGLDYGRVMQVMGEIDRAGLRRIALVSTGAKEAR